MRFFVKLKDIKPGEISMPVHLKPNAAMIAALRDALTLNQGLPENAWGFEVLIEVRADCIVNTTEEEDVD